MPTSVLLGNDGDISNILDDPTVTPTEDDIPVWDSNKKLKTSGLTSITTLNSTVSTNTSNISTNTTNIAANPALPDANENLKIGTNAGVAITTGINNTLMGLNAGAELSTGNNNTLIGLNCKTSTGSNNTVVGSYGGNSAMTGVNNVLLGATAGNNITSGSNNVFIGNACAPVTAAIGNGNMVCVGNSAYGRDHNEVVLGNNAILHIRSEANCDLGTSTYNMKDLYMNGNIIGCTGIVTNIQFQHGGGTITTLGSAYATKINDIVTLYIPAFSITTAASSDDIIGQIITLTGLLPEGTTNEMGTIVKIGTDVCRCQLKYSAGWYVTLNKIDGTSWTATSNTVEAFYISFQSANTTALSTTGQLSSGAPITFANVWTASSITSGQTADLVDDGDFETYWRTGASTYSGTAPSGSDSFDPGTGSINGSWLKVAFGAVSTMNSYRFTVRSDDQKPYSWKLYGSNDDSTYTLLHTVTDFAWPAFVISYYATHATGGTSYKYYVFHCIKNTDGGTIKVGEFEVYA